MAEPTTGTTAPGRKSNRSRSRSRDRKDGIEEEGGTRGRSSTPKGSKEKGKSDRKRSGSTSRVRGGSSRENEVRTVYNSISPHVTPQRKGKAGLKSPGSLEKVRAVEEANAEWLRKMEEVTRKTETNLIDMVEGTIKTPKRKQGENKGEEGEQQTTKKSSVEGPEIMDVTGMQRVKVEEDTERRMTEEWGGKGGESDPIEIDADEDKNKDEEMNDIHSEKTNKNRDLNDPDYNIYLKRNAEEKDDTPVKHNQTRTNAGTEISYAAATKSPQMQIKTHSKIKEAYDSYFEVTFKIPSIEMDPPMESVIMIMREKIKAVLLRAKEVDRRSKINPWNDYDDLPTIIKPGDIPFNPAMLKAYLSPGRRGLTMKQGSNGGWRIRITTHIPRDEFIHYWGLSKRDFTKVEYVTLRDAPLQEPTSHAVGYFLNSSDGQLTAELEKELKEELGFPIGISYRPAALDKRAADDLWAVAKKERMNAAEYEQSRVFFKHAPFAQQVYAPTRQQAHQAAVELSKRYGTPGADGQYPRLPDGSRMRFVAASIYLDMRGRATAASLFPQQVKFQTMEVSAPIPIRDPQQRFPTQENKTMQQLVLDLKDPTMGDEPYFRHLRRKFHWNYKTKEYEVSIHGQMYERSAKILRELKEVLTKEYGKEVGDAIMDVDTDKGMYDQISRDGAMSGITLATEDRYLNGPAQFIIVGLENIQLDKAKTLKDIRKGDDDANTMNMRSTTSDMSGQTGYTVPDPQEHITVNTPRSHIKGHTRISDDMSSYQVEEENTNTDDPSAHTGDDTGGWSIKGGPAAALSLARQVASTLSSGGKENGAHHP